MKVRYVITKSSISSKIEIQTGTMYCKHVYRQMLLLFFVDVGEYASYVVQRRQV